MKDYLGNPIKAGDILLRVVNGHLVSCVCTRVTRRVYFTYNKRIWDKEKRCYEWIVAEMSSNQNFINLTALGNEIALPKGHFEFYNKITKK